MYPKFVCGERLKVMKDPLTASFSVQVGNIQSGEWNEVVFESEKFQDAHSWINTKGDPSKDYRILQTSTEIVMTIPSLEPEKWRRA